MNDDSKSPPAFPPGSSPFTGGPGVTISLPGGPVPEPVVPLIFKKDLWIKWVYSGGDTPLEDCWVPVSGAT